MKKYFVIIPVLLLVYFLTLDNVSDDMLALNYDIPLESNEMDKDNKVDTDKMVTVSYNGQNLNMSIDDYVVHVLACEMPASFNEEALKAGAVAARTFYLYKSENIPMYVASVSDQCFITNEKMKDKWGESYNKYYDVINKVVEDTSGEFITYDGNVIQSFYFSMSNGYTENVENVFSESKPYLVSVESEWDVNLANYEKSVTFDRKDFLNKLGLSYSEEVDVKILSRSDAYRVNIVSVNGSQFKGTDFRTKLGIRSTDFDIDVNNDKVIITTRGYGHGVGLSQYGANEMAKLGYNYKDILKHYYTGVEISTI